MKEPVWIRLDVVLRMHEEVLMLHGGPEGVRDPGLLESALARPRNLFAYAEQDASIARFAAAYAKGIIANHPFVDGNKRTGFVVGILFLELNGYRFTASEGDAAQMVIALAAGTIDEHAYSAFLRVNALANRK